MRVLLVSTYELGHQPLHLASPAAALLGAGHHVDCLDLAVEEWDADLAARADAVAFSVPMHTAMRLAVRTAASLRSQLPHLPICFYGLYAPLGRDAVVGRIADRAIAGEYEPALVQWLDQLDGTALPGDRPHATTIELGRNRASVPARTLLPPLDRYARLDIGGAERLVGYVEASRGCVHRCRHCPVPVIYDGRIRVVATDTVLEDIAELVAMGAEHITFGDPDFLNGPKHSMRVVQAMHDRFPELTFDCTTKIEHILRYSELWPELAESGCLFVVTALESVNDDVLTMLDKGHTADQAAAAIGVLRRSGIEPRPSLLPFTPRTRLTDLVDLLDFVLDHDLVPNVDPVQYSIRLLLPDGSLLLERLRPEEIGPYDPELLSYTWASADPAVDALQGRLARLAETVSAADCATAYRRVRQAVLEALGHDRPDPRRTDVDISLERVASRPRLTEPWFCCAEPTTRQLEAVAGPRR